MAPRPKQRPSTADPRTRDGAPPGAALPSAKYEFDADRRATTREEAPVTIGEQAFHRRRKNWQVTRALRALLRKQEHAGNRAARLQARIDALTEEIRGVRGPDGSWKTAPVTDEDRLDEIDAQVEDLEAKSDAAGDETDEASYQIIALLLKDDDGKPLLRDASDEAVAEAQGALDHLKEHLDAEDAGDMAAALSGGGEQVADPTATETSSD